MAPNRLHRSHFLLSTCQPSPDVIRSSFGPTLRPLFDGCRPMRASAVVLLCLLPAVARAGDDVVVGMSAAFTGPSRGLGIELYRGAAACFADANANGGVNGHKIRLVARDDGYDPGPALSNTLKL